MNLFLVRHALPERVEDCDGPADPGLSTLGRKQARRLADWFLNDRTSPIHHVAASPKLRAIQTAEPLANGLDLETEIVDGFSEIDHFSNNYIPVEEMRRENHPQWQRLKNRQWEAAGFFNPEAFQQQVVATWETWRESHDEQNVMVVAHGGTINALISHFIGMKSVFFVEIFYTGVCRLRSINGHMRLLSLNETAHLETAPGALNPLPPP